MRNRVPAGQAWRKNIWNSDKYTYKVTKKVLAVSTVPWNEVRRGMQISVSRGWKPCRARVGTSGVIKTGPPRACIICKSYRNEDKWTCQRSSFDVVCFMILKWAYQQLHPAAKYVKRLGIVLWMNVLHGIGFKNSGRAISHSVMNTLWTTSGLG